jgi:hypothetical protein
MISEYNESFTTEIDMIINPIKNTTEPSFYF